MTKDLYMMIMKPCSRTCLQKLVHLRDSITAHYTNIQTVLLEIVK